MRFGWAKAAGFAGVLALDVPAKGAEFDIMVETRDSAHSDAIGQALKDQGYALRMG